MDYSAFKPKNYQYPLNKESYIRTFPADKKDSIMNVDVLFVGAGPAGLSGAIYLKKLCEKDFPDIQIAVIEKASRIGGHSLSGAVINPIMFKTLFPHIEEKDLPFRQQIQKESLFYLTEKGQWPLLLPPTMKNKNFYTASLCEVLRWMGQQAEKQDISIFTSFTAHELLVKENQIAGLSTFPAGLNKEGTASSSYQEPVFIQSPLTVLTDGSRGHLSQSWMRWKNIHSHYPQTYALGVKEVWKISSSEIKENQIWHTMGWPLPANCFGGAWVYPLGKGLLSLGLVAGLDSPIQNLDVHASLQKLKNHPMFSKLLKGGECIEWGAKTIPEGGWHSIPEKLHDDGLLIAGDSAGMVNVPALKGIHYAMRAGIQAAKTAFLALQKKDFSKNILKNYDKQILEQIKPELYPVRNVRQAFDKNLFLGLIQSGAMFLTKGKFPGDRKKNLFPDEEKVKSIQLKTKNTDINPKVKSLSKTEAVYLSGNKTRDDIPNHLKSKLDIPETVKDFYTHLCPAGVYEKKEGKLLINAPNCIDCKATDILGPRWTPREGGSGPNYSQM